MIESQVRINDVSDRALIFAISQIEREKFVIESDIAFAYAEKLVKSQSGRHLMKIRDFSKLAQLARPMSGEKVLVLGGASLYSAAIFAFMGCNVTVYDDVSCKLDGTETICGDLKTPNANTANNFDLIFVDGGVEEIPTVWSKNLKDGGRIALFHYSGEIAEAKVLVKSGDNLSSHSFFDAKPPKLAAFNKVAEFSL